MKSFFIYNVLILSFITAGTSAFDKGIEYYESRAENAVGFDVKPGPINNAIESFKSIYSQKSLEAGIYLMRCYYFKGKFIAKTDEEKKIIFSKGKDLGEELIRLHPNSAPAHYWFLVNLGSWAEVYGTLAAAKEGVANLMRDHAKKLIALDSNYSNGGGYFMLGAVHFKAPYIPFILSWPDNKKALEYLSKAYEIGISTPSQAVYLARSLHKDMQQNKAKSILIGLLKQPYSLKERVEDFEQHHIAKTLLEEWK